MEKIQKKEDENFIKFSEDIEGNKKTVLFLGAGVDLWCKYDWYFHDEGLLARWDECGSYVRIHTYIMSC